MAPEEQTLIQFEHLGMTFDGGYTVHRDINFTIGTGEVVTLLGPSGTGKTVLLKLMIGLLTATAGSVRVFGNDISKLKDEEITKVRRDIGMLFQGAALFDSLSVYDNVAYALREQKVSEAEIKPIVAEKLSLVDLPNIGDKKPPELSGGQRKRIGLARALATEPRVMLFDEPTTGLDPTSRMTIDSLIMRLRDDYKITSVVVTHDIDSAKTISDRLVLLSEGMVAAEGAAESLWQNNELVRSFAEGRWKK